MKTILMMGLFVISTSAFSAVYKSYDADNSCDLYRVSNATEKSAGSDEVIVSVKNVYGLSFENMEVDFDNRDVKVQVTMNITLGLNQSLLKDKKAIISEHNPNFTNLINHLNRKVMLFEKVCINEDQKVIYANEFKTN